MDKWVIGTIGILVLGGIIFAGQTCYFNSACKGVILKQLVKLNHSPAKIEAEPEVVAPVITEPLPATVAEANKPATTCQQNSDLTSRNFKWIVPEGTSKVVIRLLTDKGAYLDEYTITDFITINPGQKIQVIAK
jgi:hypothetical protein